MDKKSFKVNIFLIFYGTYKEVRRAADIYTTSQMFSFKLMATNVCAKIGTSLMEVCLYINEDIPSKQIHTKVLEEYSVYMH